jgi:hypothetical protein
VYVALAMLPVSIHAGADKIKMSPLLIVDSVPRIVSTPRFPVPGSADHHVSLADVTALRAIT